MASDQSPPIRDAASVILIRDPAGSSPHVLMGQRGTNAAFMPSKFVFPGGAVDPEDAAISLASPLTGQCIQRLKVQTAGPVTPAQMAAAAIRELWEEAGLRLGTEGIWTGDMPPSWSTFAKGGVVPSAAGMHFIFRAITPPKRPRRFDARFFLMDASRILGDLDDFSAASDELSHLQWVALSDISKLDLPFITEVVLAEVSRQLPRIAPPPLVPFFDNTTHAGKVSYL